jgi:hypothetical protein
MLSQFLLMIRLSQYLLFILFALMLFSCNTKKGTINYYKVRVEFDTSFEEKLTDELLLCNGKTRLFFEWRNDVFKSINFQKWDSIQEGTCSIVIRNIFGDEQTDSFDISSDTLINIKNKVRLISQTFIDTTQLAQAKKIDFLYMYQGCFGGGREKMTLTNLKDSFLLETEEPPKYTYDKSMPTKIVKYVPVSIIDSIKDLQRRLVKHGDEIANNYFKYIGSTTTYELYIKVDNYIIYFDEYNFGDLSGYSIFRQKYITN